MATPDPALVNEATAAANAYGIPPALFNAQIQQESSFNPYAVNGTAEGIAQFQPGTAASVGVTDPFNTQQALYGAAAYDAQLYQSTGSYTGMLQSYGTVPTTATPTASQSSLLQMAQSYDSGSVTVPMPGADTSSTTVPMPGADTSSTTVPMPSGRYYDPYTNSLIPGMAPETLGEMPGAPGTPGATGVGSSGVASYFVRGATVLVGIVFVAGGVFMLRGRSVVNVVTNAAGKV